MLFLVSKGFLLAWRSNVCCVFLIVDTCSFDDLPADHVMHFLGVLVQPVLEKLALFFVDFYFFCVIQGSLPNNIKCIGITILGLWHEQNKYFNSKENTRPEMSWVALCVADSTFHPLKVFIFIDLWIFRCGSCKTDLKNISILCFIFVQQSHLLNLRFFSKEV